MLKRQVIVVFGVHVLRILVVHFKKIEEAGLTGKFNLVRLKVL